MTAPYGVRYYGGGDLSGYGLAAVSNVRALVNADVPVHWVPLNWTPDRLVPGHWQNHRGVAKPVLTAEGSALADVSSLVERTRRPIDPEVVIVHAPPESWPGLFRKNVFNIGCTAWETSRTPAHWRPLMRQADAIAVPSEFNRRVFQTAVPEVSVSVLPHIRRHTWNDYLPTEIRQAKTELGIPAEHRVFYTISTWDPRKDLPELIRLFGHAFGSDDSATLLIKSNELGADIGPHFRQKSTRTLAAEVVSELGRELGRAPPNIILNTDRLSSAELDMIHAIGDVYVTVSHGEGFALGAFEAATRATPVLATNWGGQTDFLGGEWLGALPCRMTQVPLWPPHKPSYFPSQRWARVERAATVDRMRAILENAAPFEREARCIREKIVERFAEPVIVRRWLDLIEGGRPGRGAGGGAS
ncbi:glycosyltransferase family 4 protein [Wenzhouxiangella sp. EGI_FJ10305]|uniref:glycosyltransferase family 4 protein n=1 Tax=Wenzhouxiangella sp. EGI_FJ10305 TaxID=3243768 RepID=UPI0035DA02E6